MAILFIDGFDYKSESINTDLSGRWTTTGSSGGFDTRTGVNGIGKALAISASPLYVATHTLSNADSTIYTGFHYKNGNFDTNLAIVEFGFSGVDHCRLYTTYTGQLRFWTADSGYVYDTTTNLGSATWYHLEMKVIISNTVGGMELRVDGTTVMNEFTFDTAEAGVNAEVNYISLFGDSEIQHYDNFYIADSTAGQDFIGPAYVSTLHPDGAGSSAQFTPTSPDENWQAVDNVEPTTDSNYNESSTTGHLDRFTHGNLPADATTIHAVQVSANAKVSGAGTRILKTVAYDGTTEGESTGKGLSSDWTYIQDMYEDHPSGAAAWTPSEVNSGQFGYKVG